VKSFFFFPTQTSMAAWVGVGLRKIFSVVGGGCPSTDGGGMKSFFFFDPDVNTTADEGRPSKKKLIADDEGVGRHVGGRIFFFPFPTQMSTAAWVGLASEKTFRSLVVEDGLTDGGGGGEDFFFRPKVGVTTAVGLPIPSPLKKLQPSKCIASDCRHPHLPCVAIWLNGNAALPPSLPVQSKRQNKKKHQNKKKKVRGGGG
jgi:hypothetical protein